MNSTQVLYTMITNLLSTIYTLYDKNNVFIAFQNDFTLPKISSFVIIWRLQARQKGTALRDYNGITEIKTLTGFNNVPWQIDFYGINSEQASDILLTYLMSSTASDYLIQYNAGIGKVSDVKNLTHYNDRDRYMLRYTINFETLDVTTVLLPTPAITLPDVAISYEEIH